MFVSIPLVTFYVKYIVNAFTTKKAMVGVVDGLWGLSK